MTKAAPLFRSCLFCITGSFKHFRSRKRKSLLRAIRNAFPAADAVGMVAFIYGIQAHGTNLLTGSAVNTCVLIEFYADKCDLIEQSVYRTQGTDKSAERSEYECRTDYDAGQYHNLYHEHQSGLSPEGFACAYKK